MTTAERVQYSHEVARHSQRPTQRPAAATPREPHTRSVDLEGMSVATALAVNGVFLANEAAAFGILVCERLAPLHDEGIAHGSLRPDSLYFATHESLAVDVLGVAVSGTLATSSATEAAWYWSPERLEWGQSSDARSDVWSLGIVLYEMLAGRLPFPVTPGSDVRGAIVEAAIAPLRLYRPDVSRSLADTIHRCLERDPSERFATATDLAAALASEVPSARRAAAQTYDILGAPQTAEFRAAAVDADRTMDVTRFIVPESAPQRRKRRSATWQAARALFALAGGMVVVGGGGYVAGKRYPGAEAVHTTAAVEPVRVESAAGIAPAARIVPLERSAVAVPRPDGLLPKARNVPSRR